MKIQVASAVAFLVGVLSVNLFSAPASATSISISPFAESPVSVSIPSVPPEPPHDSSKAAPPPPLAAGADPDNFETCEEGRGIWFQEGNDVRCIPFSAETGYNFNQVGNNVCQYREMLLRSGLGRGRNNPARCELRVHGEIDTKEECDALNGESHEQGLWHTDRSHRWIVSDKGARCNHVVLAVYIPAPDDLTLGPPCNLETKVVNGRITMECVELESSEPPVEVVDPELVGPPVSPDSLSLGIEPIVAQPDIVELPAVSVGLEEPPAPAPLVSVSGGTPLVRTLDAIQFPVESVGDVVSELGIQSGSYVPVSAQRPPQSADSGSAAALGLAALPVALLAGWHILSPDEWSAPSFGFSGVLTDASSDAIGRMSAQRGSWSAYADAHLSRGATTEYVGGAEYRASRWLSFTYAAHAREGKSDADLVFGAVADRRFGRWLFTAGADTDVGARAQAVLSLGQ